MTLLLPLGWAAASLAGGASEAPARVESDITAGMAMVTLEAHDVSGTGMEGYQLLLDADHNTKGEYFFEPGYMYFGDYAPFEYSIPEDAEAVKGSDKKVIDGSVSILVPAGTYDWMVINPMKEGLEIPQGDYAIADDFTFMEGCEYTVVVELRPNEWGFEEPYATLKVDHDLCVASVTLPESSLSLSDAEEVTVNIENRGNYAESGFVVAYSINGAAPVSETVEAELPAGETMAYTFATKADMSAPATYIVEVSVNAEGDMLPANNTMSGKCRHPELITLPYECRFADYDSESVWDEWTSLNLNEDFSQWGFNEWYADRDGRFGVLQASCNWSGDVTDDDWLISSPMQLNAGAAHAVVDVRTMTESSQGHLQLCLAKTPNPEDMAVVGDMEFVTTDWAYKAANFEVPEAGVYYLAVRSIAAEGTNQYLAGISVGEGEFSGTPDIKIEKLFVPYSNCDLPSDYRMGMRVTNKGLRALEGFTLSAEVNAAKYETAFADAINPDETVDIYLSEPVDLSKVGAYDVIMYIDGEGVSENATTSFECFAPIVAGLPADTDFTSGEYSDLWTLLDSRGWEFMFGQFSASDHGRDRGILSRGIAFHHDARMRLIYTRSGWGSAVLRVYFGKAGADPMEYEMVYEDADVPSEGAEIEFEAPVAEPGNYSFLIADEGEERANVCLVQSSISELMPYDARIVDVNAPLSAYVPASQTGCSGVHNVEVCNRGSEALTSLQVSASINGVAVATSDVVAELGAGQFANIPVSITLPQYNEGDTFGITYSLSVAEEDGNMSDNRYEIAPVNVTATTRSLENLATVEYGTGMYGEQLFVGNVYTFGSDVDLTSVTIGLAVCDASMSVASSEIGFNIFEVNGDSVGRLLYSDTFVRGTGGLVSLDVPDMRLGAGSYLFEVAQLSTDNMGLGYDPEIVASCWQRNGKDLEVVNGRALCIRAEFAPGAEVYANDAMVRRFVLPSVTDGLFTDSETVSAVVRNAGYEDASAVEVVLKVDGKEMCSTTVSLASYEDAEVTFEGIDLSVPGTHSLECVTVMEGDMNAGNDSVVMTIESAEPLDPYVMDFEGCRDFDAAGDRFNPAWTTIDYNGIATDYFWRYTYRHRGEGCGFIAFNPTACVPSMEETPLEGFTPHSGEKFGVAFVYNRWAEGAEMCDLSNVWLVSPLLQLGDGSSLELYARTRSLEVYGAQLEPFRVLVSETGTEQECFTVVGDDRYLAPVDDWGRFEIDLSAYNGKKVYVAVQYPGNPEVNTCLMVDDIRVNTNLTGVTVAPADADAAAEYYTLDGLRVEKPSKGIYIVKRGNKTSKVIL